MHYTNGAPVGEIESYRELRDDTNRIELLADEVNGDDTYGVALRYYAENLNSTEFGFYYQNYTSRIPYIGYRAGTPAIGIGTTGGTASQVTLGLQGTAACDRNTFGLGINPHAAAMTSDVMAGITIGDAGDDILDTYGAWGALKAAAALSFTRQSALNDARTTGRRCCNWYSDCVLGLSLKLLLRRRDFGKLYGHYFCYPGRPSC